MPSAAARGQLGKLPLHGSIGANGSEIRGGGSPEAGLGWSKPA